MDRPFKIFPSIGYKNSQFQIISKVDNLELIFILNDKIEKVVIANSDFPTILNKIDTPGSYQITCVFEGEAYEQILEVKDAIRLGTSEFKSAFVFDDCDFSVLLMNDRMLIYDEINNTVLTENYISPTNII
ncbi:MAG: hypothetical protein EOO43_05780, partial [Flavobacterium sp.]